MIKLEKIVMLKELKREGLSISVIARKTGMDRKTVRKLLDRGLAAPSYAPRAPRRLEPYEGYLARKIGDCPDLSGRRLFREIQERGLPVGSGVVESACKQIVGSRFKRAGCRWSKAGANALLAVKCCIENNRWTDFLDWRAGRAAAV